MPERPSIGEREFFGTSNPFNPPRRHTREGVTYVGPVVESERVSQAAKPPPGWTATNLAGCWTFEIVGADGRYRKLGDRTSYQFAVESRGLFLSNCSGEAREVHGADWDAIRTESKEIEAFFNRDSGKDLMIGWGRRGFGVDIRHVRTDVAGTECYSATLSDDGNDVAERALFSIQPIAGFDEDRRVWRLHVLATALSRFLRAPGTDPDVQFFDREEVYQDYADWLKGPRASALAIHYAPLAASLDERRRSEAGAAIPASRL